MTCEVLPLAMFMYWLYNNTFAISLYFQALTWAWAWAEADAEAEIDGVWRVGEIGLICVSIYIHMHTCACQYGCKWIK